jgi:hypothetical protein
VFQVRRVRVLECLEFVVAQSRDPLQERVRLPPAVVAFQADFVAADLVPQVSQQGVGKVLAGW